MVKIARIIFPSISYLLDISYSNAVYNSFFTRLDFQYFARPSFDGFVQVGYTTKLYKPNLGSYDTATRQAFIASYQSQPGAVSSNCFSSYSVNWIQSWPAQLTDNNFFQKATSLNNFIESDSSDSILEYYSDLSVSDVNPLVTSLRWECSAPTSTLSTLTLTSTQASTSMVTIDTAQSLTSVVWNINEMAVMKYGYQCNAEVIYECYLCSTTSVTVSSDTRSVNIDTNAFYLTDLSENLGSRTITIRGSIPNTNVVKDITLQISATCTCTVSNIVDPYSSSHPSPLATPYAIIPPYQEGSAQQVYDFEQLTSNATCCSPLSAALEFADSSNHDLPSDWTFTATLNGGRLTTYTFNKSGTFNLKMSYQFGNSANPLSYSRMFRQEITPANCTLFDFTLPVGANVPSGVISYMINGTAIEVTFPLYSVLVPRCMQGQEISITDNNGNSVPHSGGLFTESGFVDNQTKKISIYSNSYLDALRSPYTVKIVATHQVATKSQSYTLNAEISCDIGGLFPMNENLDTLFSTPEYSYTIRAQPLEILIQPFSSTYFCGQLSPAMSIEMHFAGSIVPIPAFVSFNTATMTVTIYSIKRNDMKQYPTFIIKVIAETLKKDLSLEYSAYLTIPVSLTVSNTGPPQFQPALAQTIELEINKNKKITFPKIVDPDLDDEPTLLSGSQIFDPKIASFIKGSFPNFTFWINDTNLSGLSFAVTLTLTDNNPASPKTVTYNLTLVVKEYVAITASNSRSNVTKKEPKTSFNPIPVAKPNKTTSSKPSNSLSTTPISLKITSVSQFGEIKIAFNQDVNLPSTNLTTLTMLISNLKTVYELDSIERAIESYQVTSASSREITMQVVFTQPLSVSSGYGYDTVSITFNDSMPIIAVANPDIRLGKKARVEAKVPPQLLTSAAAENLAKSTQTTSDGLIMIICANVGLTLAGGFSMKKLWQLISTLQILVHYPLLNLPMQANVVMVLKGIQDISNLNIIPKGTIKTFINSIMRDTSEIVEGSFGDMGYDSDNTLQNMGLVAILLVLIAILILGIILLDKLCSKSQKVQFIVQKLKTKLMFNPIIQAQLKGYIKLNLSVLIALSHFSTLTPASIVINLVLLVYFVSVPFIITRFLTKQSVANLKDPSNKLKFGSLHINLKPTSASLMYTMLYLLRRFFLGVTIVAFPSSPLTQASVTLGTSLFMLVYLLHFKPHRSFNTRAFEVFNELTILSVTYLIMMNADFVTDDVLRYNIGWTVVGIIGFCTVANLANVFINMGRKIYCKVKLFLIKKNLLKPSKAKISQLNRTDFTNIKDAGAMDSQNPVERTSAELSRNFDDSRVAMDADSSTPYDPQARIIVKKALRSLHQQTEELIQSMMEIVSHDDVPSVTNNEPEIVEEELSKEPQNPPIPQKISLLNVRRQKQLLQEGKQSELLDDIWPDSSKEVNFASYLKQRANNARILKPRMNQAIPRRFENI